MRKSKYIKKKYIIFLIKKLYREIKIKKKIKSKNKINYNQNKFILSKILGKKIDTNFIFTFNF